MQKYDAHPCDGARFTTFQTGRIVRSGARTAGIPGGQIFMAEAPVTTTIGQDFAERFAGSLAMYERSRQVIPGGITHDGRHMKPFPPDISSAQGAYKGGGDGNRLLDHVVGHGSLVFWHNDPQILAAVEGPPPPGTQFGAGPG